MTRGRTRNRRGRQTRQPLPAVPRARPLLKTTDEGDPIKIDSSIVQSDRNRWIDRWIDPFLAANRPFLQRLGLSTEVHSQGGVHILLRPSGRIGAVPLVAPATRRVVAGVLVEPRFRWSGLGRVLSAVNFSVAPNLGSGPLVPGSGREIPAWLLAGPVIRRLEQLLVTRKPTFTPRREDRASPRGRIDWGTWSRRQVPAGRWTTLPCEFTDLGDDPDLMAAVRWTLMRLGDDLFVMRDSIPARRLAERVRALLASVGDGQRRRPSSTVAPTFDPVVHEALEAMSWVADGRGLGGQHALDGLPWDLAVADVWEAWVRAFAADLAPVVGLRPPPDHAVRRALRWQGRIASMSSLAPDVGLIGENRTVWIDAKYKAHLAEIARRGWRETAEHIREAHRADLHQALAYAALADTERVDTVLLYPHLGPSEAPLPVAVASLTSGKRQVRLVLGALPFGFSTPAERDASIRQWRELLAA